MKKALVVGAYEGADSYQDTLLSRAVRKYQESGHMVMSKFALIEMAGKLPPPKDAMDVFVRILPDVRVLVMVDGWGGAQANTRLANMADHLGVHVTHYVDEHLEFALKSNGN